MAEAPRSVRDELATLRIDRDRQQSSNRPPWVGIAAVIGIAAILALLSWFAFGSKLGAPPQVRVAYATRTGNGDSASTSVLSGSGYIVTGDRYISLGVRVPGKVLRYLVEEGEEVASGQALVQLDDRQYTAALREARASLRVARANIELRRKELQRLLELHNREYASQASLDVKENELRVAEAEADRLTARIARLQVDLEETVIRAPANGVVLEKFKEVGEIATPGGFAGSGELIRRANLEELRAEVDISEMDLSRVAMEQLAEVVPDAYPDRSYSARVIKMYPQINRQKGTLKVEVRIDTPDAWLRPDMSVRINFLRAARAQEDEPVVLIPRSAARSDEEGSFVWVVSDKHLRRQEIAVAGNRGDQMVISKGLLGGEALVVGEPEGLVDGRSVEIAP